jgi:hypothetical protein
MSTIIRFGRAGLTETLGVESQKQRPVGVLRIDPEVHLVRLHLRSGERGRHVVRDERRMHRVGEVEELDVEREGRVVPHWAGVDDRAAAESHHHQQLLLRPDAELARRDPDLARVGQANLADDRRVRGVGDVGDQDPRVRVRAVLGQVSAGIAEAAGARAIGPVPDVDVVVVDRERGVHPARNGVAVELVTGEVVVPDELEIERCARSSSARPHADVSEGDER